MQEAQDIIIIKLFLGCITFLLAFNIALMSYMAKKYVKRADEDHDLLQKLKTEHIIFHKDDTGINRWVRVSTAPEINRP